MSLYAPISPHSLLPNGFSAKKSFGQNFLHDTSHLEAIAKAARAFTTHNGCVVEWGAGLGALTAALLNEKLVVHAVERDRDLIPLLRQHFSSALDNKQLCLHEADAAQFSLENLPKPITLCGNLPYHLSSTLLLKTLESTSFLSGAVFLLQKEVVERIVAASGSKTYGLLSVLIQAHYKAVLFREVKKGAFWPPPKIDSAVLHLTPLPPEHQPQIDNKQLFSLVKMAFNQRRKTLRNALASYPGIEAAFEKAQIDPSKRAEQLTVADFIRLAKSC